MTGKAQDSQIESAGELDIEQNAMEKPKLEDTDIALRVLTHIETNLDIDPQVERRLVGKIDYHIIPLIAITYFVTYIDKTTLSYAALFGLKDDVGLHGMQYSWLGSIFYFGYVTFEYIMSFAMQKFSVGRWMAGNIIIWGGICAALGDCSSFGSPALRFILEMLESCSTPEYLLITSMLYKVEEQPIRIGCWSTFLGLATAFGGLIAYAICEIHGELATWRYQFSIVGAISSVWGIALFFLIADNPTNAP